MCHTLRARFALRAPRTNGDRSKGTRRDHVLGAYFGLRYRVSCLLGRRVDHLKLSRHLSFLTTNIKHPLLPLLLGMQTATLSRTSSIASISSTEDAARRTRKRFSTVQLMMLEQLFHSTSHPTREEREALANAAGMYVTLLILTRRPTCLAPVSHVFPTGKSSLLPYGSRTNARRSAKWRSTTRQACPMKNYLLHHSRTYLITHTLLRRAQATPDQFLFQVRTLPRDG